MIYDDNDRRTYEEYVANHLWIIANSIVSLGGGELNTKTYSEIIHPEVGNKESAEEIKRHIIERLQA